jgi:phosphohistidine phosphatase
MLIILLRHGVAEERSPDVADAERRLTKKGKRKMKKVAKRMAKMLPDADALFSSPLVRAFETAECVAKAYDRKLEIETTPVLEPGASVEDFRSLLRRSTASCAYFTGHEPHLTSLMLALTGLQNSGELALKKGGAYGLELDRSDGIARLRWMLAPKLL